MLVYMYILGSVELIWSVLSVNLILYVFLSDSNICFYLANSRGYILYSGLNWIEFELIEFVLLGSFGTISEQYRLHEAFIVKVFVMFLVSHALNNLLLASCHIWFYRVEFTILYQHDVGYVRKPMLCTYNNRTWQAMHTGINMPRVAAPDVGRHERHIEPCMHRESCSIFIFWYYFDKITLLFAEKCQ